MGCGTDDKKLVFLVFHREALIYDITNCAFVQGDVIRTKDEHERHQVMDIGEEGNVDRVTRVLNLAYQECVDMLYAYTKADVAPISSLDNTFGEPQVYKMRLLVPKNFAKGTVALLKNLIHEYLVCRVLEDWKGITYPEVSGSWREKVENVKDKIMECMNARSGRVRRSITPF